MVCCKSLKTYFFFFLIRKQSQWWHLLTKRDTKSLRSFSSHLVLLCREELVSAEDLLQWLRPFCADDTCPVRPRIQALQILGQSFHLSEEDSKLLVFFRTEAILRAAWPQRQVSCISIHILPQPAVGRGQLQLLIVTTSVTQTSIKFIALAAD